MTSVSSPAATRRRAPCPRTMRSPSTDSVGAPLSAVPAVAGRERQPDGTRQVEGLRMSRSDATPFIHRAVMEHEVVDNLISVPAGLLVDATVGGGGHSAALLAAHPGLRLLGIDRDPDALEAARARLAEFGPRVRLVHARFDAIAELVAGAEVTAVLFDLGVSSPQLDRPERGFSYRQPGPLDMRMDPTAGLTAADVVNTYAADRLAALFRANGEGRFASRIARLLVAGRPFTDTVQLAEAVRSAIPAAARRHGGHPARRVFQAIRIEVNGELDVLDVALTTALGALVPGGRLAVISYHSGEDRLVKVAFATAVSGGCTCPPGMPCVCGAAPVHRLVFRGSRTPSDAEIGENPRAESARLRVIERTRSAA
jgi:16S rRNA (cytosine1402-N4)-methyltransferase